MRLELIGLMMAVGLSVIVGMNTSIMKGLPTSASWLSCQHQYHGISIGVYITAVSNIGTTGVIELLPMLASQHQCQCQCNSITAGITEYVSLPVSISCHCQGQIVLATNSVMASLIALVFLSGSWCHWQCQHHGIIASIGITAGTGSMTLVPVLALAEMKQAVS